MKVQLNSGHFSDGIIGNESTDMIEKDAMLVYCGKFQSMDGEVEIKDEHIEKLASEHNSLMSKLKRLATGDVPAKSCPPIQLDHSTSAKDTVGRLVGDLRVGDYSDEGETKKALFGKVRILGAENVAKIKDGRWTHLSIGADLETGKLNELTITPFPAAPNASLLGQLAEAPKVGDKIQIIEDSKVIRTETVEKVSGGQVTTDRMDRNVSSLKKNASGWYYDLGSSSRKLAKYKGWEYSVISKGKGGDNLMYYPQVDGEVIGGPCETHAQAVKEAKDFIDTDAGEELSKKKATMSTKLGRYYVEESQLDGKWHVMDREEAESVASFKSKEEAQKKLESLQKAKMAAKEISSEMNTEKPIIESLPATEMVPIKDAKTEAEMNNLMAENYLKIAGMIRDGKLKYADVQPLLEVQDNSKLYAIEECLERWEKRGIKIKGSTEPQGVALSKWQDPSAEGTQGTEKRVGDYRIVPVRGKKGSGFAAFDKYGDSVDGFIYSTSQEAEQVVKGKKLSKGEDMDKDKEKMKKHLMEEEKMSAEEADEKMSKMSEEETKELAAKCEAKEKMAKMDNGNETEKLAAEEEEKKKLAAEKEAEEKKEEEKKMARMKAKLMVDKDFSDRKSNMIKLAKGIRTELKSATLSERKVRLMGRLTKLRIEAKISPAEIKAINVDELAGLDDKALEAVINSYDKREPVVMAGVYGTMKAEDLTKLAAKLQNKELLEDTVAHMPFLKMAKENSKGKEVKMGHLEQPGEAQQSGGDAAHIDIGSHMEEAFKLWSAGDKEGALKHLMDKFSKMQMSGGGSEVVGPLSHGMEEHEKRMSALAESVKNIQNQSEELIKLVSDEYDLADSDLN